MTAAARRKRNPHSANSTWTSWYSLGPGTISAAALILRSLLRRALGLPPGGDLQSPLAVVVVMAAVWATTRWSFAPTLPRGPAVHPPAAAAMQAAVRRLYSYLVAGIGLAAFLTGLIALGRVLIEASAGGPFGDGLKDQLAWGTGGAHWPDSRSG